MMSHLSLDKYSFECKYIHTILSHDDYISNYSLQIFLVLIFGKICKTKKPIKTSFSCCLNMCFVFQTELKVVLPGSNPYGIDDPLRKGRNTAALVASLIYPKLHSPVVENIAVQTVITQC